MESIWQLSLMQFRDPSAQPYVRTPIRMKFTPEEDHRLREIVRSFVTPNWAQVSALMGNRTPRQCRERYRNYLAPQIINGRWTEEEERLLEELVAQMGPKWSRMAPQFPTRSDVNLKNHWSAMSHRKERIVRESDPCQIATGGSVQKTKLPMVDELLSVPSKPHLSLPAVSTLMADTDGRVLPLFEPAKRGGPPYAIQEVRWSTNTKC